MKAIYTVTLNPAFDLHYRMAHFEAQKENYVDSILCDAGGKGINIPLIPQFATGTDSTPDTFIAGEQGAELITNAKNRSVFTAAQTGSIFRNLADTVNAIRTAGAAPYQLAYAGAPSVAAPTLNAGGGRTSVVIHSAPVFHVGNDAQAQDIEEMLRRHDEELLDEIDERERQRQDDERRRNYD